MCDHGDGRSINVNHAGGSRTVLQTHERGSCNRAGRA